MTPDVFRAVADPTRRAILDLLADGELAVKDLQPAFLISQPGLSQHLRVLREAGPLAGLRGWLERYERFWDERLDRLGHALDAAAGGEEAA